MVTAALWAFLWMYLLFQGFLIYASVKRSWSRLKVGIKVLEVPVLLVFGLVDVAFNLVIGSILFMELPFRKVHRAARWWHRVWTFSQRCSFHLNDAGWRGSVAGAFSVPLNVIDEGHIR